MELERGGEDEPGAEAAADGEYPERGGEDVERVCIRWLAAEEEQGDDTS